MTEDHDSELVKALRERIRELESDNRGLKTETIAMRYQLKTCTERCFERGRQVGRKVWDEAQRKGLDAVHSYFLVEEEWIRLRDAAAKGQDR